MLYRHLSLCVIFLCVDNEDNYEDDDEDDDDAGDEEDDDDASMFSYQIIKFPNNSQGVAIGGLRASFTFSNK